MKDLGESTPLTNGVTDSSSDLSNGITPSSEDLGSKLSRATIDVSLPAIDVSLPAIDVSPPLDGDVVTNGFGSSLSRTSSSSSVAFHLAVDSDDDFNDVDNTAPNNDKEIDVEKEQENKNCSNDGFSRMGHKRTSPIDNQVESKKAKLANGHIADVIASSNNSDVMVDNVKLAVEKTSSKRPLENSEPLGAKKSRVVSSDKTSSNGRDCTSRNEASKKSDVSKKSDEASANGDTPILSSLIRKPQSNIDKAIERVALCGLDRKERIMMPFMKDLKNKRLKDITMDDVEEIVAQRVNDVLTSEIGDYGSLREKMQKLERAAEFWKTKSASLQKQMSDMTMVFKKLAVETKQNPNQMQIPIKITRSVGLQVVMPSLQSLGRNNTTPVRNGMVTTNKRKSGGIMTNRNTTPTIHYPQSSIMNPNRPPVVQKVMTPPTGATTPTKVTQGVGSPVPKPALVGPPPPGVRFRAPNSVATSVVAAGAVTTVAGGLRIATSTAQRPVVKTVTAPRQGGDMLIDLTDEDDKSKRVPSNALVQTVRLAQINGSPPGPAIRIVSPQQLTGSTTGVNGVNGQRLAYMLPASAANSTTGRLQLFTQQTGGGLRPGGLVAVSRPNQMPTLMLKNGTVVSSAGSTTGTIIRTAGPNVVGGSLQQVMTRPGQIRPGQPGIRMTNAQVARTLERPVPSLIMPSHAQHPAPLPPPPSEFPSNPLWKKAPPRPDLKISKVDNREQHGIILSWNMDHGTEHEEIASYQLYAYQENNSPPSTSQWKKVGDVKAMPLPMACTLTQFLEGNKYHFAVRAVDIHSRCGLFSIPGHIILPRRAS